MTKPYDPFSRLYWKLIDDEKFTDVYPDDHAFALWGRLLLTADMAWPASASLPFGTRKVALAKLVAVRLVDILPGGRYRIHGLDTERGKRQQKAKEAAASRWDDQMDAGVSGEDTPPHPASNANGDANGMLTGPPSSAKRMPTKQASEASTSKQVSSKGFYPAKALVSEPAQGAMDAPDEY